MYEMRNLCLGLQAGGRGEKKALDRITLVLSWPENTEKEERVIRYFSPFLLKSWAFISLPSPLPGSQ